MRSLFLEPSICIIGLCRSQLWGKREAARDQQVSVQSLPPAGARGLGWAQQRWCLCGQACCVARLAPLKDKRRAGGRGRGSFRAAAPTLAGDRALFRVAQGPVLTGLFFIRSTRSRAWAGMSLGREREVRPETWLRSKCRSYRSLAWPGCVPRKQTLRKVYFFRMYGKA